MHLTQWTTRYSSPPLKDWVSQALHSLCLHPTWRVDPCSLTAGVPQGWGPGPLLVYLYTRMVSAVIHLHGFSNNCYAYSSHSPIWQIEGGIRKYTDDKKACDLLLLVCKLTYESAQKQICKNRIRFVCEGLQNCERNRRFSMQEECMLSIYTWASNRNSHARNDQSCSHFWQSEPPEWKLKLRAVHHLFNLSWKWTVKLFLVL